MAIIVSRLHILFTHLNMNPDLSYNSSKNLFRIKPCVMKHRVLFFLLKKCGLTLPYPPRTKVNPHFIEDFDKLISIIKIERIFNSLLKKSFISEKKESYRHGPYWMTTVNSFLTGQRILTTLLPCYELLRPVYFLCR